MLYLKSSPCSFTTTSNIPRNNSPHAFQLDYQETGTQDEMNLCVEGRMFGKG